MDVREELVALYRAYNPRRIGEVDDLLVQFRGRERSMLAALREKYTRGDASVHAPASGSTQTVGGVPSDEANASAVSERSLWPAARAAPPPRAPVELEQDGETAMRPTWRDEPPVKPTARVPAVLVEGIETSGDEAGHGGATASDSSGPAQWRARFPAAAGAFGTAPASSTGPCVERRVAEAADFHRSAAGAMRGSSARRTEMRELLRRMSTVDLAQLADRVAALAASAHTVHSPPQRVPRLQWGQGSSLRDSLELSARAADGSASASGTAAEPSSRDDTVAAVLQHTAVFLSFFSQCAHQFMDLAHTEAAELDEAAERQAVYAARHARAVGADDDELGGGAPALPSRLPTASSLSAHHETRAEVPPHSTTNRAQRTLTDDDVEQPPRAGPRGRAVDVSSAHGGVAAPKVAESEANGTTGPDASVLERATTSPTAAIPATAFGDAPQQRRRRTSCVRDVRHPAQAPPPRSQPPPQHQQQRQHQHASSLASESTAAAASPHTDTTASPRPRRRRGSGSPPTYRTTTVSPLTSPETPTHSPGTSSPPSSPPPHPPPSAHAPQRDLAAHPPRGEARTPPRALVTQPVGEADSDEVRTPPPPTHPLPPHGALVVARGAGLGAPGVLKRQRVHTWTPSSEPHRYRNSSAALQDGDCVVLQPGVYYESLVLEACGHIELTSAYPGAAVVLRPASELAPALTVRGAGCCVELRGIVLVQGSGEGDDKEADTAAGGVDGGRSVVGHADVFSATNGESHGRHLQPHGHPQDRQAPRGASRGATRGSRAPAQALLAVRDGAELRATACHFYGGAGGGVVVSGANTRALLDLCLIAFCSFAGVYVHGGASVQVTQSKVKKCEAGLRAVQATFIVQESTMEENKTDGLVVYEGSMGLVEQCCLMHNSGNGIYLEGGAGAEVRVVASTVELNALYGVQRFRGSTLHVRDSFIRDNGLLPISEEAA